MNNTNKQATLQILYVCDALYLQKKMSRVRFWVIEELSKHEDINLLFTGPGFRNFNDNKTLQQNIIDFNICFDLIIWYKPLNENYHFDKDISIPYKTCIRYNEMWDEEWTRKEIDETGTDIIICHHYNDYLKYRTIYKDKELYYIPHCSNTNIFKPLNTEKSIDIMISGVTKKKHYPFKHRLLQLILEHQNTTLKEYTIHIHKHPGYNFSNSFENINQIKYNELINKSKLNIACTSKYMYRLGKYVDIPMAGGLILGDIPFEDPQFNEFVVEINDQMNDDTILNVIKTTLQQTTMMNKKRIIGLEWSKNHSVKHYVNRFLQIINTKKIYIISDEIRPNHPEFKNEKWICDVLKQEFMDTFPSETTCNAAEADIIWYLGPWNHRHTPSGFSRDAWLGYLKTKKVICTQHHIDLEKIYLGQLVEQFKFMREYGTHYHAICDITKEHMKYYLNPSKTSSKKLWANNKSFYPIADKKDLRNKHNMNKDAFLIGSFQKDTEGKSNLPKMSKGPDLFVDIVKDKHKANPKVEVVLSGLRREYIMHELDKAGIKYYYFNMVPMNIINELYNCLDLYIVSSRCEGGPRSVFEAGLTRTPIISTKIGIAPELMNPKALFDHENWTSYKHSVPDSDYLYNNVSKLMTTEYMQHFKEYLLYI
tara:strand:+ start:4941 stop:6893 length:1953 start_codon:yes stop_codon:yes gene_type:complete